MRCGLFTGSKGDILLAHYEPLQYKVDYIEYDVTTNKFSLVYETGVIQHLGLEMDDAVNNNLLNGIEVTLAYMKDQKFISTQKVVFIIQMH